MVALRQSERLRGRQPTLRLAAARIVRPILDCAGAKALRLCYRAGRPWRSGTPFRWLPAGGHSAVQRPAGPAAPRRPFVCSKWNNGPGRAWLPNSDRQQHLMTNAGLSSLNIDAADRPSNSGPAPPDPRRG